MPGLQGMNLLPKLMPPSIPSLFGIERCYEKGTREKAEIAQSNR
jgi:hypothetical protein